MGEQVESSAVRSSAHGDFMCLTTWEGAQREQLRRRATLTLEEIILAQQEMRELSERLAERPRSQE